MIASDPAPTFGPGLAPANGPGLAPGTIRRVDEIVARTQSEGRAPSVVAGVVRAGRLCHVASAGEEPPPGRDVQYRIGSISKSLTAALVLQLRDEGRLTLEDPLAAHLPEVGLDVGAVSVRHLLGHIAGLQREPEGEWWERSAGGSLAALLTGVGPEKLAWAPVPGYHYSNLAYGLLGGVVAGLTGATWMQAVRARLLEPLGMHRTTYGAQEPFARGYVVHPWHGTLREEPRHDAGAMAPAGQLWSTIADMSRWAAFLCAPEPAVLSPETVATMASPAVIADPESWHSGYGLGLQLWRRGDRVFAGHTGSMPGYLAVLAVHRSSGTGVVGFANTYTITGGTIGGFGLSILEAVLDAEPAALPQPWRPAAPPPPEVEPLCGRWWWMGREFEARWDPADGGALVLTGTRAGAEAWRFVPEGVDRWRGRSGDNDGEILRVCRDPSGTVSTLDIATFIFTRDPMPPE